ncbi:trace amine-associated receptor 7d-like [Stylophora pistillata]|uniref:trace amine-associated receptor 7d-like n=1 Tax=Stylophora pistillata TaxID=50429 RepID=UPI000C0567AB|nr:trace amine-associated receptor 7d-like [Stylophora pistillata]
MNSSEDSTSSCPITFPGDVPGENVRVAPTIAAAVLTIFSSFIATTANFLVMWAIRKTPSLHTPSAVFLFNLALSDFVVGIYVQPLCAVHLLAAVAHNLSLYCTTGAMLYPVGVYLSFYSLMIIAAVTVDRYLALVLHLRYAAIITVRRVIQFNIAVVIATFPVALCYWFLRIDWIRTAALLIGLSLAIAGTLAVPLCYYKIFMILRRHKRQLQDQNNLAKRIHGFSQNDLSKYRKSVLAILYVLGVMILSYLPGTISFVLVNFFDVDVINISKEVLFVSAMVVLWNSSFNPLFYCWRITEIRRFVISKLQRLCRVSGLSHNTVLVEPIKPFHSK